MRLLSLFSGIGAFEKALENIGVEYELVGFSEIDKWAIQSYCAIHEVDESLNLGDISKIKNEDLPKKIDMVTYGFPCQDISIAGNQAGIKEGTRSGLLYEAERIIQITKPKYAIAENVKNLVGKRHKEDFDKLLERLDSYGYNNYWQVLNAKDYGIPQNRERVFIVSIRKDIDDGKFKFPEPFDSGLRLKDLIENHVDQKYYLTNNKIEAIYNWKAQQRPFKKVYGANSICGTITARGAGEYHSGMILYSPMLIETTNCESLPTHSQNLSKIKSLNLRVLTPRESYRIMGFDDKDFENAQKVCSDRQLYKQAGNSIVVNVLEEIFKNLFKVEVIK